MKQEAIMSDGPNTQFLKPAVCFVDPAGALDSGNQIVWAKSLVERLKSLFEREGVETFISTAELPPHNGPVVLVRADAVIDGPLISYLVHNSDIALLSDDENIQDIIAVHMSKDGADAVAALANAQALPENLNIAAQRPNAMNTSFWSKLRKRETPYARIVTPEHKEKLEWRMFMGTYKGATDFVTKYLWPKPAYHVTRYLAPTFVTPNLVTTLSAICVLLAFWLFWEGHYVTGLIAAWIMTFLDTVDGKLARTTLTSSKWGDIFDHGIDLVHPPFWYAAWAIGLPAAGFTNLTGEALTLTLGVIIIGYIAQRILEGISIALLKLEIHIWRPIDTQFRLITARRNPNLVILTLFTVLAWRPDLGLIAVAVWTFVCFVLHLIQLAHALFVKSRKGQLTSWMSKASSHQNRP